MADISRDTFDRSKRQTRVVFQEKKPLLNYELNLATDILNEKLLDISNNGIGNNYVGDAMVVAPSVLNNEIFIKKGIFHHKGYLLELTEDIRINGLSTPGSNRIDTVYAEWYVDESDGTDDPSIVDSNLGFETTVQERVVLEIKVRENAEENATNADWYNTYSQPTPLAINPDPVVESITYDNSNKTISLSPTSGNVFPDWILHNNPVGVTFTTSDPKNPGPFTINATSPLLNKRVLVVNETLDDATPSVSKLTFYDSNSAKTWIATGRNFFKIADLQRVMGNAAVTQEMIVDVRDKTVFNFIIYGCEITQATNQSVKLEPGRLLVGDTEHFIEEGVTHLDFSSHPPVAGTSPVIGQLLDNTINFAFINKEGLFECTQVEPVEYIALLAEVYTDSGEVVSIIDRRHFVPLAWKNKYAGSGSSGADFPVITFSHKAGENIPAFSAVTHKPGNQEEVILASAVDLYPSPTKLPATGIAAQAIPVGQVDNIITFGAVQNPAWNFTFVGLPVYIDVALGQITQVPPTAKSTYTQIIGFAESENTLFVSPGGWYIKNNPAEPFDTNFLVKRPNGIFEEAGNGDKFSPDKLSFLAAISQNAQDFTQADDKTFDIYPGRYYINDNDYLYYSGETINLGSGTYQTSPLTANFFNKAFFTLDDTGTVKMYESLENSASASVFDPEIPDNELPISMVIFQDDGGASAGTVKAISQDAILDKRGWLNLGNLDNTAFKPVYRDNKNFLVQKGEGWFNNYYIDSNSNIEVTANTAASGSTYYIYMDVTNATGSVSSGSFTTMLATPSQVDKRRFVPLAEYEVNATNDIDRTSFKAYKSKFWQYRDTPYSNEETFNLSVAGDSAFTLSNFTFLSSDFLDIKINGRQVYENEDYTKVAPNLLNFGYTVKKGTKMKVRKV